MLRYFNKIVFRNRHTQIIHLSWMPWFNSTLCFFEWYGLFQCHFWGTPCGKCHKDCLDNSPCIQCSICDTWVHYKCSKLTALQFNTNPYFFCSDACEICLLPFTDIKTAVLVKNEILAKNADLKPKKVNRNKNTATNTENTKSNISLRHKCLECNKACRKNSDFFNVMFVKYMIHRKC